MVFLLALALSFIPAFIYAAILYWLDRFEKEPRRMLFGAFLWGALVATSGALIWSSIFEQGLLLLTDSEALTDLSGATIVAPVVEECLKSLAVLLIFLAFRHEFDSVLDGIVYAGITALGFAATENLLYLYFAGYQEGGMTGLIVLFVLRVILGGWGHAVYTAFFGIGLAVARLSKNPMIRFVAPILGLLIAILLHALHNGMATVAVEIAGGVGLLATLLTDWTTWLIALAIIVWEIRRERSWITTYLQEEVREGIISQAQYSKARSIWGRIRGSAGGKAARRFYQLCAELAQKKHQLQQRGDERGNQARIAGLRAELQQLAPQVA
jgi:protease PrsW